ncbi:MAG: hypothetical protein J6T22_00860 [Bacteroidales bacterium]|nr:hypothetical protein [Bacteroidales bacterium]
MEDKINTGHDLIEIEINYDKSYLYRNEKGLWLVLDVIAVNMTDESQFTGYAAFFGKLCPYIITPAPQKGKLKWPLPPKTVNATITDGQFQMAPHEDRNDTLVVSNLDEKVNWYVGIGDKAVLVDKTQLHEKTKLD